MTVTQYLERLNQLDEPAPNALRDLDEIHRTDGWAAAKAEACRRKRIWFASAGAVRKR